MIVLSDLTILTSISLAHHSASVHKAFSKHFLADDILRKLPGKSLKTAADCLAVITYSVINLDIELSSFAQFLFTSTQCFKVIVKTCGATHMHTHQLTQMGPISDITKK